VAVATNTTTIRDAADDFSFLSVLISGVWIIGFVSMNLRIGWGRRETEVPKVISGSWMISIDDEE